MLATARSAGAGQDSDCEVKQVLVAVSQQLVPLDGAGQLLRHCAFVVQFVTHMKTLLRSSVDKKLPRSAGSCCGTPSLPQPGSASGAPSDAVKKSAPMQRDFSHDAFLFGFTPKQLH